MGKNMVKEQSLFLMEENMKGSGRMGNGGTEYYSTKMGKSM
jgi:hypothetical protein